MAEPGKASLYFNKDALFWKTSRSMSVNPGGTQNIMGPVTTLTLQGCSGLDVGYKVDLSDLKEVLWGGHATITRWNLE